MKWKICKVVANCNNFWLYMEVSSFPRSQGPNAVELELSWAVGFGKYLHGSPLNILHALNGSNTDSTLRAKKNLQRSQKNKLDTLTMSKSTHHLLLLLALSHFSHALPHDVALWKVPCQFCSWDMLCVLGSDFSLQARQSVVNQDTSSVPVLGTHPSSVSPYACKQIWTLDFCRTRARCDGSLTLDAAAVGTRWSSSWSNANSQCGKETKCKLPHLDTSLKMVIFRQTSFGNDVSTNNNRDGFR